MDLAARPWLASAVVVATVLGGANAALAGTGSRRVRPIVPSQSRRAERAAAREHDLSDGGRRRGGLEFGLASVAAVTAGVLIGRGTWELVRASREQGQCTGDLMCSLGGGSTTGARAAGGLTLAFSVPLAIASGFLFRRGARTLRDYRKHQAGTPPTAVVPHVWASSEGVHIGISLRF